MAEKDIKEKELDSSDDEINLEPDDLYDEHLDDKDEEFVLKKMNASKNKSEAVLYCPLCMIPICYDCQRHVKYSNQYRAMFVENIELDLSTRYHYNTKTTELQPYTYLDGQFQTLDPTETRNIDDPAELLNKDTFFKAHCQQCKTLVGVYDHEEIFHLFSVLASPV